MRRHHYGSLPTGRKIWYSNKPVPREIPALPTIEAMARKGALYAALAAVCPHASWVQTYSEAEVGRHFLDHYGHIELFGPTGIFQTQACRAFIGYWGPKLFYPMHYHEAEEIYLVLTGRCLFEAEGIALPISGLAASNSTARASPMP